MTLKEAYDKGFKDGMFSMQTEIDLLATKLVNDGEFNGLASYDPPKEEDLTIDLSGTLPHVKGTPHISHDLIDGNKYNTFDQWADHVEGEK